jgi:hypothetical protein
MKLFQKAQFSGLWRTAKKPLSHTHTDPKVILTACESFKSEKFEKLRDKSACSEDSASLHKIKIEGL